jgi:hypothetical protein
VRHESSKVDSKPSRIQAANANPGKMSPHGLSFNGGVCSHRIHNLSAYESSSRRRPPGRRNVILKGSRKAKQVPGIR